MKVFSNQIGRFLVNGINFLKHADKFLKNKRQLKFHI